MPFAAPASSTPDSATFLRDWRPTPLAEAHTFPACMYTDPAVWRLERERFFARSWLYVGNVEDVPAPNTWFTQSVAGFPLIITRDASGALHAFHNACPHRGAPLASPTNTCGTTRLTCPYHAWTFDCGGNLRGAPGYDRTPGFAAAQHGLGEVRLETWGPFIFVNLARDAAPIAAQLGDLPAHFDGVRCGGWTRVHRVDYVTESNWKLYVENNAEYYHEPVVHVSTYKADQVSWNNAHHLIQAETAEWAYLQYSPFPADSRERRGEFPPGTTKADMDQRWHEGSSIMSFWPNFAWILQPNVLIIYLIDPLGPGRTRIRWDWLVPNTPEAKAPENLEPLIRLYDRVQIEDLDLLPQVQLVADSPGYVAGPLYAKKELGVHRFQELLMDHLTGRR